MTARTRPRRARVELLHFSANGQTAGFERRDERAGLTHISLSVEDLEGVLAAIGDYGGEVIADSNIGAGVFVRISDGQLVSCPDAHRPAWRRRALVLRT